MDIRTAPRAAGPLAYARGVGAGAAVVLGVVLALLTGCAGGPPNDYETKQTIRTIEELKHRQQVQSAVEERR